MVAVERGDCWNTYGLTGEGTVDEIVQKTRRRNEELDRRCEETGRDPASLRRSLVMWPPLDPWASSDAFVRLVEDFRSAGIREFFVMWPGDERVELVERAAAAMPSLRGRLIEPLLVSMKKGFVSSNGR